VASVDVLPYREDDTIECIAASWRTWAKRGGGSKQEDGCPFKISRFVLIELQGTKR
jgi:hypothetical protein